MNILLLGGTGAMGTPLANILSDRGFEVTITSREDHINENLLNIKYVKGDAHNLNFLGELLNNCCYTAIVDFLKYTSEEFKERIDLLLGGTKQYFLLSSCRVYAESEGLIQEDSLRLLDSRIKEEDFNTERYALTKAYEENILKSANAKNWTIIRPYLTYNDYRLQLGFYEKDQWLNRILQGRTVVFPGDLLKKHTTLTHGEDVARAIAGLIGNREALGAIFNITSSDSPLWEDVICIYSSVIYKYTGIRMKIALSDNIEEFYRFWPTALIKYDRMYNRSFDCSKLMECLEKGDSFTFKPYNEGIERCIKNFLEKPVWSGKYIEYEAWSDKVLNERTPVFSIPGKRNKLKYFRYRYFNTENKR